MDSVLLLFVLASFLAIAGIAFVVGQYLETRIDLRRRMPAGATAANSSSPSPQSAIGALVSETFTEERFGVDVKLRQKLRRDLVRAGFFSPYAVRYYVFSRFCTVVVLPMAVFLLCEILAPGMRLVFLVVTVVIAAGIGVLGPDAYLSRRQNGLMAEYRLIFPDLLDLLNVCISAGLSVEASFDRVREHIAKRSRTLGRNIELMGAEMRAGRSTIEALSSFADRLALDEAAVLCRGLAALRRTGRRHRSVFERLQRRHAREEDVACGKEGKRTAGQDGHAASAWDFSGYPDACSSTSSCETGAGFEVRRWRSTHAGNRAGESEVSLPRSGRRDKTQSECADKRSGDRRRQGNPQTRRRFLRGRPSEPRRQIMNADKDEQEKRERQYGPWAGPQEGDGQQLDVPSPHFVHGVDVGHAGECQDRKAHVPRNGRPATRDGRIEEVQSGKEQDRVVTNLEIAEVCQRDPK